MSKRLWSDDTVPTKEGWYFWKDRIESDPWRYIAVFVMEDDPNKGETSYWDSGVCINTPKGGAWSSRVQF